MQILIGYFSGISLRHIYLMVPDGFQWAPMVLMLADGCLWSNKIKFWKDKSKSRAQFATFWGRTIGPRTTGPRGPVVRGPICHFWGADNWAPDSWAPIPCGIWVDYFVCFFMIYNCFGNLFWNLNVWVGVYCILNGAFRILGWFIL